MEKVMKLIQMVQAIIGTLDIKSTRHNCDAVLGTMQILDKALAEINALAVKEENNDHDHTYRKNSAV